jgi:hypothetical protein
MFFFIPFYFDGLLFDVSLPKVNQPVIFHYFFWAFSFLDKGLLRLAKELFGRWDKCNSVLSNTSFPERVGSDYNFLLC